MRVTPQRLAVYRVLAEQTSHPTAERVSAAVRERMRSLSPATVYRILDSLREAGLIRRVSTYAGVARYDANLAPHHHLVCRLCGEMTDLPAPALEAPRVEELHVPGFVVEELELRVLGRCRRCRPRSQST